MKCCAVYGFVQGKNELCAVVHLELIIRAYFILTSIAANALIRIKLERASPSPEPLRGPLAVLCSQKPFVMVTDLT